IIQHHPLSLSSLQRNFFYAQNLGFFGTVNLHHSTRISHSFHLHDKFRRDCDILTSITLEGENKSSGGMATESPIRISEAGGK
ncbi:hypothetical protein Lal_00001189, partial [Lupinus albus]